jgi:hypothetical protein
MMVYNNQDYWVFGLCPSSGILKTKKITMFRKLNLFASSGEWWETPTLLGPLERANINHWAIYINLYGLPEIHKPDIPFEMYSGLHWFPLQCPGWFS